MQLLQTVVITIVAFVSVLESCGVEGGSDTAQTPTSNPVTSSPFDTSLDASGSVAVLEWLAEMKLSDPAAYDSALTFVVLTAQMHLGKVGFGLGPYTGKLDAETAQAIRSFEAARGLPITGDVLSARTLSRVLLESAALTGAERSPAPSLKVFGADQWDAGYVLAQGTWIMEDQQSPFHEVVRIECFRSQMQCDLLSARLGRDDNTLTVNSERYELITWDATQIWSQLRVYPCAQYVLHLNRVQQLARTIRRTTSTTGMCQHMTSGDIINRIATWQEASDQDSSESLIADLYQFGTEVRKIMSPPQP